MTDRTIYWTSVRAQEAALRQQFHGHRDCHVTAIGPTPRVVEVSLDNASRLLTDGSHRLSTEAEIAEYQRAMELRRAQQAQASGGLQQARALFAALGQGAKSR